MKLNLLIFFVLLQIFALAQHKDQGIPLNTGLYGAYGIQPGIKLGTEFGLRETMIESEDKTKYKNIFLSPQIGVFVRPENHTSFLVNADIVYKMKSDHRKLYIAPSIGVGYLMARQILDVTVDLSNGEISNKNRELRHYFLPVANFEFGKEPKNKMGWYSKFSYGRKISSTPENSGFFAIELGLKFRIKKKGEA